MNHVTLTGNLVEDPVRREYTNRNDDRRSYTTLRIGNNERVGERDFFNGFFDVTVYGQQAKHVLESYKKGERIVVTGRLNQYTYDREDGSKGSATRIVAAAVARSTEFQAVASPTTDEPTEEATPEKL